MWPRMVIKKFEIPHMQSFQYDRTVEYALLDLEGRQSSFSDPVYHANSSEIGM